MGASFNRLAAGLIAVTAAQRPAAQKDLSEYPFPPIFGFMNELVYALDGLTAEETKIVEGSAK
jgi:hypothetical protein